MKNVYLFQPQYSIEYRKEINHWLPYSAGCLWSYASQFDDIKSNFCLADLIFRREDPKHIIDRMVDPVYCGFSAYVWNFQYCLSLAEMIKKKWPKCVIQFGGPQASGKYLKYNFIDSLVMGEGEEKFVETLRSILKNEPPLTISSKQRLASLDIPSPYTTGVFDKIMAQNPTVLWSMTLETNRGCPYACTFCDWGGVTYSKVKKFDLTHIQQDLEWATKNLVGYVFLADANFGIFKERDLEIAKLIRHAADHSKIESINVQYAKNSTNEIFRIAKILEPYSRGLTVSVQSLNPDTLTAIKRDNLDVNDIAEFMKISETAQVKNYTELIIGLPLETIETWKQGVTNLLELGQHQSIEVWFAQLLENSELSQMTSRQQYNISIINASDYTTFRSEYDYKDIVETIELVNSTSTMSTLDIIEGYMYAWMIINFHIIGYTQNLSKYARFKKNIPYRTFYDALFKKIQTVTPFKEYYSQMQTLLHTYLTTGKIVEFDNHSKGIHGLTSMGGLVIYQNRQLVYQLSQQIVEELAGIDPTVKLLQQYSIVDQDHQYPTTINLNFNPNNWQDEPVECVVTSKVTLDTDFDFYMNRRKGLLKNQITTLQNVN